MDSTVIILAAHAVAHADKFHNAWPLFIAAAIIVIGNKLSKGDKK